MKKVLGIFLVMLLIGCKPDNRYRSVLDDPETYRAGVKKLTDVIIHDIFSPPVASRIYAYPNIAAYEVMVKGNPERYHSLAGQLNELTPFEIEPSESVDIKLASIHAFLTVAKAMIFSEQEIEGYQNDLYTALEDKGLPSSIKTASLDYGQEVAKHILDWANGDMYKQTRTFPKYSIRQDPEYWKPTPPDYMEGIEPAWKEIRTMVLDSAGQFPPIPPVPYSMDKQSEFYRQLIEVYEVGKNLDEERTEIAQFWDCNPYVSHHRGHAMFATKKITPGGHWIGITMITTRQAGSDYEETVEAMTRVSIALFDGFISCWDEKWRSIVIRPETVINEYLDESWLPLLQTPPFPEYTSGHSVISRSAAVTLTDLFGDQFAYNDTTEMEYGLKPRDFTSFLQASEEAAISRLYGGIHYMMAIDNGVDQGEQVGNWVVANLKTRRSVTAENEPTQ